MCVIVLEGENVRQRYVIHRRWVRECGREKEKRSRERVRKRRREKQRLREREKETQI